MEFWRLVPHTGLIPRGPYKESEGAGIRFASIAAYGLLLDKNEAKEDNTLQRDCGAPPRFPILGWCTHPPSFCECRLENCLGMRELIGLKSYGMTNMGV